MLRCIKHHGGRAPACRARRWHTRAIAAAVLMTACALTASVGHGGAALADAGDALVTARAPAPRIIMPAVPLQCVPYARQISKLPLRGDAWTWWQAAAGLYRRQSQPGVGSVLVMKRTKRLRRGHVAVVSGVLGAREILVDHANWLNRGHIHKDLLVKDVSADNDWSLVRVWYAPGNTLGKRTYPVYGFIHPEAPQQHATF